METQNSTALGEALRRERRRRKETQTCAAARFGVSQPSYHRWEAGETVPSDGHYGEIAEFLGVSLEAVWQMVNGRQPEQTNHHEVLQALSAMRRDLEDVRQIAVAALAQRCESCAR